jgi:hypothetical protein
MKSLKNITSLKKIKSFFSDRENVIIVCLSILLVLLIVNYLKKNEFYTDISDDSNHTHEVVLFWVEWCPHCTKLIGPWRKMENSKRIIKVGDKLVLIKNLNVTGKETELPKKMYNEDLKGFPQISVHESTTKKRVGSPYSGQRNENAILKWVKSLLA